MKKYIFLWKMLIKIYAIFGYKIKFFKNKNVPNLYKISIFDKSGTEIDSQIIDKRK